jgi:hypothetical protein
LRVEVGALELTEFGDPHARGIEDGENGAMLEVAGAMSNVLISLCERMMGSVLGFLGEGMYSTIHERPKVVS